MAVTDKSSRNILVTAFILIVLQGANLVGIAINRADIKHNYEKVEIMYSDYVPLWLMQGLQENNDFKNREMIIAVTKVGSEKQAELEKISRKYLDFQKSLLNQMAQYRGGVTIITRSAITRTIK
ncbi:MAG TPA: hypothetical protein VMV86_05595 [Methanosarcinales archaeon]|nr:hypothetical protein [Methanosarcinales archaeon]